MRLSLVPALALGAILFGGSVSATALASPAPTMGAQRTNSFSAYARARIARFESSGMRILGPVSGSQRIQLVILPKYDHQAELDSLGNALSTRGNPLYHHFLTGAQFKRYFGPSDATLTTLLNALRGTGFNIDRVSRSGDLVVASASAPTVEKLFGIPLYAVRKANGSMRYANLDPYSIPQVLASTVYSLTGLDSATEFVPASRTAKPDNGCVKFCGATPQQLESANDMPVLHGYPGSYSQVLTVLIDGRPNPSDVASFLSIYSIKDCYPIHQVNTGNGQVGGDKIEATLDVETIAGTAPCAYLALYTMPDLSDNSVLQGVSSFVNNNASGNSATLSMSFGGCDNSNTGFDNSFDQEANTARSKGQTFLAATGDYGVNHCSNGQAGPADVPASDPLVVAVGGTSPDTQYNTPWGGGPHGQYGWVGSGGGTSSYYGKPPYQNSLGCGKRCVPDIAVPADPDGGLLFYCSGCGYPYNPYPVGGTSLASPLAAAAFAEMAQMRGSAIGFAGNALYADYTGNGYSSGELVDITAGNNGAPAGPRWDFVTGIGTPDWYLLSKAI